MHDIQALEVLGPCLQILMPSHRSSAVQVPEDSQRQGYVRLVLRGRDGNELTFSREIVPTGKAAFFCWPLVHTVDQKQCCNAAPMRGLCTAVL